MCGLVSTTTLEYITLIHQSVLCVFVVYQIQLIGRLGRLGRVNSDILACASDYCTTYATYSTKLISSIDYIIQTNVVTLILFYPNLDPNSHFPHLQHLRH